MNATSLEPIDRDIKGERGRFVCLETGEFSLREIQNDPIRNLESISEEVSERLSVIATRGNIGSIRFLWINTPKDRDERCRSFINGQAFDPKNLPDPDKIYLRILIGLTETTPAKELAAV